MQACWLTSSDAVWAQHLRKSLPVAQAAFQAHQTLHRGYLMDIKGNLRKSCPMIGSGPPQHCQWRPVRTASEGWRHLAQAASPVRWAPRPTWRR